MPTKQQQIERLEYQLKEAQEVNRRLQNQRTQELDKLRKRIDDLDYKVQIYEDENYLWDLVRDIEKLEKVVIQGQHLLACNGNGYCDCAKRIVVDLLRELEA